MGVRGSPKDHGGTFICHLSGLLTLKGNPATQGAAIPLDTNVSLWFFGPPQAFTHQTLSDVQDTPNLCIGLGNVPPPYTPRDGA